MATIDGVLAKVAELKPHAYSDDVMAGLVAELDGQVALDVMHMEFPPVYGPEDRGKPLLVGPPHENIYELYLMAFIDLYNREMTGYEASMATFSAAYDGFCKWYIRSHVPPSAVNFRGVL